MTGGPRMRTPNADELAAIHHVAANPEPDPADIAPIDFTSGRAFIMRMLKDGLLVLAVPHDIRVALEEGEPLPWQSHS